MATLTMIEPQPLEQRDKPERNTNGRHRHDLSALTTESPNVASQGLDTKSAYLRDFTYAYGRIELGDVKR